MTYHLFRVLGTDTLYLIDHKAPVNKVNLVGERLELWWAHPSGDARYGRGTVAKEVFDPENYMVDVIVGKTRIGKIENLEETLNQCIRVSLNINYEKEELE